MNKSFFFARFGIRRGSLHSIGAVQAGAGGFWILFLLLWRATGADTSAKALSLLVVFTGASTSTAGGTLSSLRAYEMGFTSSRGGFWLRFLHRALTASSIEAGTGASCSSQAVTGALPSLQSGTGAGALSSLQSGAWGYYTGATRFIAFGAISSLVLLFTLCFVCWLPVIF